MCCFNPNIDVNKLALIGAILVLMGDFLALLVAYQAYCDSLCNKNAGSIQTTQAIQSIPEVRSLNFQRFRQGLI